MSNPKLILVAALGLLGLAGCVAEPAGPAYYGTDYAYGPAYYGGPDYSPYWGPDYGWNGGVVVGGWGDHDRGWRGHREWREHGREGHDWHGGHDHGMAFGGHRFGQHAHWHGVARARMGRPARHVAAGHGGRAGDHDGHHRG